MRSVAARHASVWMRTRPILQERLNPTAVSMRAPTLTRMKADDSYSRNWVSLWRIIFFTAILLFMCLFPPILPPLIPIDCQKTAKNCQKYRCFCVKFALACVSMRFAPNRQQTLYL